MKPEIIDYENLGSLLQVQFLEREAEMIDIDMFEEWLHDSGHMEGCNVSPDHNGEPVESPYEFADFEEWSLDKLPSEVIKVIQEYLDEQK